MPGQETDIQTIPATAMETDAAGSAVSIDPTKALWSIDDPTVATLTQNADGSATFKALKLGTANVTVTDSATNLTATDTLTVVAGPANTLSIQWGTAA